MKDDICAGDRCKPIRTRRLMFRDRVYVRLVGRRAGLTGTCPFSTWRFFFSLSRTWEGTFKMKSKYLLLLAIAGLQSPAGAQLFSLGTAQKFAVLGGSTVTNTGSSVIMGDLGVSPGSAITGFPPGTVVPPGTIHAADAVASLAQSDATTSYNVLAGLTPTLNLTGQDLGGKTLVPGVYRFDSSAQLTGTLTLNSLGNPDALFVFQIGSTLTTASNAAVVINGGNDCNTFWQIGSSATLGTTTAFKGNILANQSITLNTGADIVSGRALAQQGAVTLDTNNFSIAGCPLVAGPAGTFGTSVPSAVPEPGAFALFVTGLPLLGLVTRRRLRR